MTLVDWSTEFAGSATSVRADGDAVSCAETTGAAQCEIRGVVIGTTRGTVFLDAEGTEASTYRVGVGTNAFDDDTGGDVFLFSDPVRPAGT